MHIYLREINPKDSEYIVKWRNHPQVLRHCMDNTLITVESQLLFYNANILTHKFLQFMVEKMDETYGTFSYPIASVYLKNLDKENGKCELGMIPSDDSEWDDAAKMEAIRQLTLRAFHEFRFHKVYAYVFADCEDEVRLMKSVGFEREGYFREDVRGKDGAYRDVVRMCRIDDRMSALIKKHDQMG